MGKFVKQVNRQHGAAACRARKGRSVRSHLMTSAAAFVAAASFHPSAALAQENVWEGDADRDWYKDENWSENDAPVGDGQADEVVIDVVGPNSPVIEYFDDPWEMDRVASSVSATVGSIGSGELTIRNGGAYRVGSGALTLGDQAGSRGLVTVNGGGRALPRLVRHLSAGLAKAHLSSMAAVPSKAM